MPENAPKNWDFDPEPTDADSQSREQLSDEVQQLASFYANRDGDTAWQQELKRVQKQQQQQIKEKTAEAPPASSNFSGLFAEILASALAYLTWIIVSVGGLVAIGGGLRLWTSLHPTQEPSQPLAYNIPQKKPDDATIKAAAKALAKMPAGTKLSPSQQAAAKAAVKPAGKNGLPAGNKGGASGAQSGDAKNGAAGSASGAKSPAAAQAEKMAGADKADKPVDAEKSAESSEGKNAGDEKSLEKAEKATAQNQKNSKGASPEQKTTNNTGNPKAAPRFAALPKPPGAAKSNATKPLVPESATAAKGHRATHSATLLARLKTLWRQGAAAKHRGDFGGARNAWRTALKICPGHPGFSESIAKLPRSR